MNKRPILRIESYSSGLLDNSHTSTYLRVVPGPINRYGGLLTCSLRPSDLNWFSLAFEQGRVVSKSFGIGCPLFHIFAHSLSYPLLLGWLLMQLFIEPRRLGHSMKKTDGLVRFPHQHNLAPVCGQYVAYRPETLCLLVASVLQRN